MYFLTLFIILMRHVNLKQVDMQQDFHTTRCIHSSCGESSESALEKLKITWD